ncbi:MAG: M48 family metallopeptidase [gamma proteobacterium endosymbiont of Lamellibrachia anaximandri]|nr:M48 family metallopeptidase [gamma proteobacterium endosymbiont of Lamellibrachia anaximandri]MBL3617055.1 M48 family metallopeptidase [gamma proteobacterium endosymbiont of Lamellibrachia anaximandri]
MPFFTQLFLLALAAGTILQLWLLARQTRHVGDHREKVPEEFSGKVELNDHQKAADYTGAKAGIARLEVIFSTLLLLVWTLGGGLDMFSRFWNGLGFDALLTGVAFIFSVFFISSLLDLPFSLWRTFKIEAAFGFNRSTLVGFFKDRLLGAAIGLAIGAPLLWVILWLMDSAGIYWWLAAWAVWISFTLTLTWAYPRIIAPLFNKFTPLEAGEMRDRIQGLLRRCGFTSDGIFVMDGSKRSSHGNAYFTGFGKHKRIVFFDTLIETLTPDEMEAVLAHELGHFRRKHILKQMVMMALISLAGLALLGWLSQQTWFYTNLGMTQPSNAAALLLFMLAAPVFTLFFSPIGSYISRRHEFEADDYAIAQTKGEYLVQALVKLYQDNASTLTPDPLYSMFHDSHPPAPVRIAHITEQS